MHIALESHAQEMHRALMYMFCKYIKSNMPNMCTILVSDRIGVPNIVNLSCSVIQGNFSNAVIVSWAVSSGGSAVCLW